LKLPYFPHVFYSSSSLKEVKGRLDRLQQDSQDRIEELEASLLELKLDKAKIQTLCDSQDTQQRESVLAARAERDDAVKRVTLITGELESSRSYAQQLETQKIEMKQNEDALNANICELREKVSEVKSLHEEDLKNLQDKLSASLTAASESESSLRKEQLKNIQLQTKVQLESQRASDFKSQVLSLSKQVETLNKTLQDQIDRKSSDEVKTILKALTETRSRNNYNELNYQVGNYLNYSVQQHDPETNLHNGSNLLHSKSGYSSQPLQNRGYLMDDGIVTSTLNNSVNSAGYTRMFRSTEDLQNNFNVSGSSLPVSARYNASRNFTTSHLNINNSVEVDDHYNTSTKSFRDGLKRLIAIENDMSDLALKDTTREIECNIRPAGLKQSIKFGVTFDADEEKDICEISSNDQEQNKVIYIYF